MIIVRIVLKELFCEQACLESYQIRLWRKRRVNPDITLTLITASCCQCQSADPTAVLCIPVVSYQINISMIYQCSIDKRFRICDPQIVI